MEEREMIATVASFDGVNTMKPRILDDAKGQLHSTSHEDLLGLVQWHVDGMLWVDSMIKNADIRFNEACNA